MVYRIFVEKKPHLRQESGKLLKEFRDFLGITGLTGVRLINRYDIEDLDASLFKTCKRTIFSEPQQDTVSETLQIGDGEKAFAVEYLPGQFDVRADSAEQCVQIVSLTEHPRIRTAKVYVLSGELSEKDVRAVRDYVINPVESREASMEKPGSLKAAYEAPSKIATLSGFTEKNDAELEEMIRVLGLAMDLPDLIFCRTYFREERRDPTITELRMLDTYWSDHCRHTTFLTSLDSVRFEDAPGAQEVYEKFLKDREALGRTKPVTLMELATFGGRLLKAEGKLPQLDESKEINACTVKMDVDVDGKTEKWLLLFKNETHNHPTEIEPFGGAATCIGGAIRDPLSGRAYVCGAMRLTGAADPLKPLSETLPGRLPQRKIVTTAAAGYSSYGNQIGLATGQVDEIYHDGYAAKHMELGAVIGAVPAENVRREEPLPGDVVLLLGGRTGRDGIGGATGSSKSHNAESLESCGAEVQKGNAPIERKLQRLFRNKEASLLIKRCNDFGAGGVSVAIGELSDGLDIDLDKVPKKYEGLDGTELAISESQERMAVVVAKEDVDAYIACANAENLEATPVAKVKADKRLTMRWNGQVIVDISREFLNSNGAEKHADVLIGKPEKIESPVYASFAECMRTVSSDLNLCSKRGLSERFDSTIGRGTVLMPFGGKRQLTPCQAMVTKIPVEKGHTEDCSFMAWGFNPFLLEKDPFDGAYLSVVESLARLAVSGADMKECYLTFQEYFRSMEEDPSVWGEPAAALLGALKAQEDFGFAAIGGKDSMSGSFREIHVPPTLVSFAVSLGKAGNVLSPEFKGIGHEVVLISPRYEDGSCVPCASSEKKLFEIFTALRSRGYICASATPGMGGIADSVLKMTLGNDIGFRYFAEAGWKLEDLSAYACGSIIAELADGVGFADAARALTSLSEEQSFDNDETRAYLPEGVGMSLLGSTMREKKIAFYGEEVSLAEMDELFEGKLESVYPCNFAEGQGEEKCREINYPKTSQAVAFHLSSKPHVLIPVFPGTNCEYDSMKAFERAGADPETFIFNNLTKESIADAVKVFSEKVRSSQIIFIPGGFSGGDEPDGSGKFITAFFRSPQIRQEVNDLLKVRKGLMAGICNGFQALIKLGLLPYGEIVEASEDDPTLTFNLIGRHQSRIVRTRICSNISPWLSKMTPGEIYSVPISHGEGRLIANEKWLSRLIEGGQVATQYVDGEGNPAMDIRFNPNGSVMAIEGITSPDGAVLGKMGHSERTEKGLYANVPGNYNMDIFASAVRYFR